MDPVQRADRGFLPVCAHDAPGARPGLTMRTRGRPRVRFAFWRADATRRRRPGRGGFAKFPLKAPSQAIAKGLSRAAREKIGSFQERFPARVRPEAWSAALRPSEGAPLEFQGFFRRPAFPQEGSEGGR